MNDHELLRAFEECSLPYDQWTHRCHVKVAYLYLRGFPYEQALAKIRNGIQKYNAAKSVVEGPTRGYNETMTQAFARLIAATIDAYEPVMPTSTADEFCDAHPQLMTSHVLRLFYSPAIRTNALAKTQFIAPDLATLPVPKAFVLAGMPCSTASGKPAKPPERTMATWDTITFDCYGTLIDWEQGIRGAFGDVARRAGGGIDPDSAVRLFHEEEPVVESADYRPYRDVLAETAFRVAARLGVEMYGPWADFLSQSLPYWPPFPDTNAALLQFAAAGLRLGILSNVDDDLLAGSRNQMADVFQQDLIVTAQQVRSYKPGHRHFVVARDKVGNRRWLHVAASCFHDVKPATEVGVPVVWVNRKRESLPSGYPAPLVIVSTLAELADWLGVEQGATS